MAAVSTKQVVFSFGLMLFVVVLVVAPAYVSAGGGGGDDPPASGAFDFDDIFKKDKKDDEEEPEPSPSPSPKPPKKLKCPNLSDGECVKGAHDNGCDRKGDHCSFRYGGDTYEGKVRTKDHGKATCTGHVKKDKHKCVCKGKYGQDERMRDTSCR